MLKGKWMHTYVERGPDGKWDIEYQGQVLDYEGPTQFRYYPLILAQLYSFLDGSPTCQQLIVVDEHTKFYDTNEDMVRAYYSHRGMPEPDIDSVMEAYHPSEDGTVNATTTS